MDLIEFIQTHATRGECGCGKCIDRGDRPDPTGHVADTFFFKVAAVKDPDPATFRRLTAEHRGEFCAVNPLDGKEHNYMELGGWIGDQGLALMYMGLGNLLGAFDLLTPHLLGDAVPAELKQQMAGMGMVSVIAKPAEVSP